jgi:malate dehydrogenase (oxaloacetate-decarboxylating)(NADP+)
MPKIDRRKDALDYHSKGRPGKIEVIPTKETKTQRDLSLAYSPGVAEPCKEIEKNPESVYKYTAKGNLVAVISNGTAVLGLGDIGPAAGKPVMEGKGLLFKIFADIDVFDIELDTKNVDEFVRTVKILEPTFGGVNLEDIKAPECFEIEERLKKELNIPVMHDDQHGTAIISSAGLLNALEVVGKKISEAKIVVLGAGASAISCTKLYVSLGAKKENIVMFDSKGAITATRKDLDKYKIQFATKRKVSSLESALKGADVFLGLSKGNTVTPKMLKGMAKNPIVFALANPDPEISPEEAIKARPDLIMATGRSDYANQVNNVLGFPYIFRGALDVRATEINEAMKLAAVRALADLAKLPVPDLVNIAYNEKHITFGRNYIIPKPVDPRLLATVAPAVAKAAMKSGVAKNPIKDFKAYENELSLRLGQNDQLMRLIGNKAKRNIQRVVMADAENIKILKAAQIVFEEGIAIPILLGNRQKIKDTLKLNSLHLNKTIQIIDPAENSEDKRRTEFGELFFEKSQRKGFNLYEAKKAMKDRNYYGAMMVETEMADALISGLTRKYSDAIRPALQVIGTHPKVKKIAGMYILITKQGPLFFADTTVNTNPNVDELVEITELTATAVKAFNVTPRIAFLSYSNFGSAGGDDAKKMQKAVAILKERNPDMIVDGEIQANIAFNQELIKDNYPFSDLAKGEAPNVLIFPSLSAGNIAYNLLATLGKGMESMGPLVLGLNKPAHVLHLGSTVREIVNMVTIAAVDAQHRKRDKSK